MPPSVSRVSSVELAYNTTVTPAQITFNITCLPPNCRTVILSLPGKRLTIDTQTGVIHDQTSDNSTASTIAIVAEFHDDQKSRGLSESTIACYRSLLAAFAALVPEWPPTIEAIRTFLDGYRERGRSDVTLAEYWGWLNTWFKWAQREGYISTNPMLRVPRPERPHVEADVIPPQDLARVIDVLKETITSSRSRQRGLPYERAVRDLAIIHFAYATGCRISEMANLKLRDLHLAENKAVIRTDTSKSRHTREVYFGQQTRQSLAAWLEIRPARLPSSVPSARWARCRG